MSDNEYFAVRASVERELSEAAADPRAAAAHAELAERFATLASGPQTRRAKLRIAGGTGWAG